MVFDSIPALKITFEIVFPIILLVLLVVILISSLRHRKKDVKFMSFDEFLKSWMIEHGQGYRLEEVIEQAKKDPMGGLYMPITYKGGKIFAKLGFTANKVSLLNLILSFFILYLTIMAGDGHFLNLYSQQPFYGAILLPTAFLVLFTGIIDGIDGAIARLLYKQTKSGGWLDAIIDRISDILTLVCLVPGGFLILPQYGIDFTWLIWTNIFIIFLYEYMRAKHHEVGFHEIKPQLGERPARVLIQATFYMIYGISSFTVMLTYMMNPTGTLEATIWYSSHTWVVTWIMLIFQISLFVIMSMSIIKYGLWIWRKLKDLDKQTGSNKEE